MSERSPEPYASALDLPSVAEMLEQIKGMKVLTRFFSRHLRSDVGRIEATARDVAAVVDTFYALLGDRSWIFHDHLNLEEVRPILNLDADEAERALINVYKEPETLERLIRMLTRFPEMRIRMSLIEGARQDFLEGRYYSTVLALLAVMDGFVNEFDAERRGLHTRTAEEMTAWDSVVGHHRGLSSAHRTFTKRFSRTSSEPIYELYRNGIVHGKLVNYDNDIVASKAWNRLFAVADWATGRQRQAVPKEPKPTLRALARQIRQNEEDKRILAAWQPRTLARGDVGFLDEPMYAQCVEYMEAWKAGNFGSMAHHLSSLVTKDTHKKTAGMVRDEYGNVRLDDFSIERLDLQAAAVCEVDARLVVNGEGKSARLRWIREGEDGTAALPNHTGSWKLVLWGPAAMFNRAANRDVPGA
jgi:hypothetical protein